MNIICKKCKHSKPQDAFYKSKAHKGGFNLQCRDCCRKKHKVWREANKETVREKCSEWRKANPDKARDSSRKYILANPEKAKARRDAYSINNKDKLSAYNSQWQKDNPDKVAAKSKAWRKNNQDKVKEHCKANYAKNKEKLRAREKAYRDLNREKINSSRREKRKNDPEKCYSRSNERYKTDPEFRLVRLLRNRLGSVIRNKRKSGSAVALLGCSTQDVIQYLESKFQVGMTWENWGEWHIDHKKPLASFNLEDETELAEACHYTNLQPLWAIDNIKKSNKIIELLQG